MTNERMLQSLSDDDLLRRLEDLTHDSRRVEADLVAHIGEVDKRRLYARHACPSMFVYCTERLHLSEAEAFLRIGAARAAREHPLLLEMLADGRIHLSGIALLAPHLTADNRDAVLSRAVHRSKREIAELVAELAPRADVVGSIRKLPGPQRIASRLLGRAERPGDCELRLDGAEAGAKPDAVVAGSKRSAAEAGAGLRPDGVVVAPDLARARASVEPIAPARYKVQFTAGRGLRDKLERLRALMRRCSARERLEFHHRRPYAHGGGHSVANVALLCRAHNAFIAEIDYGGAAGRRTSQP